MSSRGGGGRGRGRGRGGGRGPLPRDVQVSKKMSKILRHAAAEEGLTLGPGGYVSAKELLESRTLRSMKVSFDEIRSVVSSNEKQRFNLIPASSDASPDSNNPSNFLIRANQGHSVEVDNSGLLELLTMENESEWPSMVVHGTTASAWSSILTSGGLKKMKRNHIHFAAGLPAGFATFDGSETQPSSKVASNAEPAQQDNPREAQTDRKNPPVISGMRNSSTILIYVDFRRALAAGIPFHRSANNVILSEGQGEEGLFPIEFFERVEDRKNGMVLVQDGKVLN
ncbi:phosphotransferase KptA/Tpt1 [Phyllosticta citrichinensis]|uniref:2'-phosphotransferase n=1 Tax=Phyllosticta citrichinensis TaxID=1130410 RepID=A0ABR1XEX8_9PEZI